MPCIYGPYSNKPIAIDRYKEAICESFDSYGALINTASFQSELLVSRGLHFLLSSVYTRDVADMSGDFLRNGLGDIVEEAVDDISSEIGVYLEPFSFVLSNGVESGLNRAGGIVGGVLDLLRAQRNPCAYYVYFLWSWPLREIYGPVERLRSASYELRNVQRLPHKDRFPGFKVKSLKLHFV